MFNQVDLCTLTSAPCFSVNAQLCKHAQRVGNFMFITFLMMFLRYAGIRAVTAIAESIPKMGEKSRGWKAQPSWQGQPAGDRIDFRN